MNRQGSPEPGGSDLLAGYFGPTETTCAAGSLGTSVDHASRTRLDSAAILRNCHPDHQRTSPPIRRFALEPLRRNHDSRLFHRAVPFLVKPEARSSLKTARPE